tara:strand:- start:663 stop:839 length:177 start_codon:yes stop_codon:yes gene_type:complete
MWQLTVFNPIDGEKMMNKNFKSLNDIHKEFPKIKYDAWRNLAIGRSKIYKPFFDVKKI